MNEEPNRARAKRAFGARGSIAAVMGLALACSALALTAPSASAEDAPAVESSTSALATPEEASPTAGASTPEVDSPDSESSTSSPSESPEDALAMETVQRNPLDVDAMAMCHQVGGEYDGTWDIVVTVENKSEWTKFKPTIVETTINDKVIPRDEVINPEETKTYTENVAKLVKPYMVDVDFIFQWKGMKPWKWDIESELEVRNRSCPTTQVTLTCAAGLTVDLSGFATRRDDDGYDPRDRNGGYPTTVLVTLDGVTTEGTLVDGAFRLDPTGALSTGAEHSASVSVPDARPEYNRTLTTNCPAAVVVPGGTTTVTVPGPTVSATATVTATPSPAVAPSETATPVVTPEPAVTPEPVVITPEPATAPTVVNAGDGSSAPQSGLPLWAMALAAVAAIGAAGASVRLATKKH